MHTTCMHDHTSHTTHVYHIPHMHHTHIYTYHIHTHIPHTHRFQAMGVLGQVVDLSIYSPQGADCKTLATFLLNKASPHTLRIRKLNSSEKEWKVGEFIGNPTHSPAKL